MISDVPKVFGGWSVRGGASSVQCSVVRTARKMQLSAVDCIYLDCGRFTRAPDLQRGSAAPGLPAGIPSRDSMCPLSLPPNPGCTLLKKFVLFGELMNQLIVWKDSKLIARFHLSPPTTCQCSDASHGWSPWCVLSRIARTKATTRDCVTIHRCNKR